MWWHRQRIEIQDTFIIDGSLPATLRSLSDALGIPFSDPEIERLLCEAEADQVSAKSYCFYNSPKLQVSGVVDEYEPEMVRITFNGRRCHAEVYRKWLDDR